MDKKGTFLVYVNSKIPIGRIQFLFPVPTVLKFSQNNWGKIMLKHMMIDWHSS